MGIIRPNFYDAFISYARDDNLLHDDAVRMFHRYFKPRFEAELRLRGARSEEARIFIDTVGLPANGDLTAEIQDALSRTVFLIIFVGKAYPNSTWCGQELALFLDHCSGERTEALNRLFVIVLDKAVENRNWGAALEEPERPIFERFYDEDTGIHFPPTLEDRTGQAVAGPRFLRGTRKVANTMAERSSIYPAPTPQSSRAKRQPGGA